ncbi:uncharacterized protein LOC129884279 [Solanum dulcamara]|uniref:uncharacterized protein LOC129884279 n=1 Tax=Solanum dulcamara TaxID=45834 RepID=UPI002486AECC|nr:uncharacterized protein LOC129884279 [Solanum dulcamara]
MRFAQLARFSPEMVSIQDVRNHRFMVIFGDHLIISCVVAALNPDIDISRLMAHARQIEGRLQNRKAEREREQIRGPRQLACFREVIEVILVEVHKCKLRQFGVEGHKMHDSPSLGAEGRGDRPQYTGSARASSSSTPSSSRGPQSSVGRGSSRGIGYGFGASSKRIYALVSRQDSEASLDVVIGTLSIFFYNVYALIDPGATLSYVTPFVAMNFEVETKLLREPFTI